MVSWSQRDFGRVSSPSDQDKTAFFYRGVIAVRLIILSYYRQKNKTIRPHMHRFSVRWTSARRCLHGLWYAYVHGDTGRERCGTCVNFSTTGGRRIIISTAIPYYYRYAHGSTKLSQCKSVTYPISWYCVPRRRKSNFAVTTRTSARRSTSR